jgi:hypothetical protein
MKASPSRDPRRRSTSIAGRTSLGASGRASLGGRSSLGPAAGSGVPRVSVGASRVSGRPVFSGYVGRTVLMEGIAFGHAGVDYAA